ncbi:MAG: hypothetical protein M1818_005530 [Claussenomyces sp. TS43310]|nr:MAG: hypothetical protein M1818_005530 [Claussenomyces sp. TS43310]
MRLPDDLVIRSKQSQLEAAASRDFSDNHCSRLEQVKDAPATGKPPLSPIQRHHSPSLQPKLSPPPRPAKSPTLHNPPHQHNHEYAPYRPPKRPQMESKPTVAVVNSSGRQAASFIRVASAVGYHVRAHLRNLRSIVANEIASLPNVQTFVGDLYTLERGTGRVNLPLIADLFRGAQVAFINTTFWSDEVAIGRALADAAKRVNVKHYIYSSMPDHSRFNPSWPSLPLWSAKTKVEDYVQEIGLPATFVYTGIYNNNFTSLPYPLFCMELQKDGSFVWQSPFHPDVPLPWLDAEHDVGAAVLQLIKDGPRTWLNERIMLAYEMLSPTQACRLFEKGVGRPVRYVRGPVEVKVPIPAGYKEQLEAVEKMYNLGRDDPKLQPPYFGCQKFERSCPEEALALWEGYRGLEEYAREVFPVEEWNNGLTWMNEDDVEGTIDGGESVIDDDDGDSDVLTMGKRREETWLA